jgi:hypothetical protein
VRYVEASDLTKGIAAVAIRPETDVHVTQLPAESGGKGDALKVIVLDDRCRYARVVQPLDIEHLLESDLTGPAIRGFESNSVAEQAVLSWVQTGDRPLMRHLVEWLLARLVMVPKCGSSEKPQLLFWYEVDSAAEARQLRPQSAPVQQDDFRTQHFEPDAARRVYAWRIQKEAAAEDGGDEAYIDAKEKFLHTQKARQQQKRSSQTAQSNQIVKMHNKLNKMKAAQKHIRQVKKDNIETSKMNTLSASIELEGRREKVNFERQSKRQQRTTIPNGSERVRYGGVEHTPGPWMGSGPSCDSDNKTLVQQKQKEAEYVTSDHI